MAADPLIVTLQLDAQAQARFDALRAAHFPPERLLVGAHVTLFHALPGDEVEAIAATLAADTAAVTAFTVLVSGARFLGRGVAFTLESAELRALRERLRTRWAAQLTSQDRQKWHPHVTVQNKADPAVARALFGALADGFHPYTVHAIGLQLWHYRGGPWEEAAAFRFHAPGRAFSTVER